MGEEDVEVTVEVMEDMKNEWPALEGCSLDKGFSSRANILALGGVLSKPALPKKGKLSKADKEREREVVHRGEEGAFGGGVGE